MLDFDPWNRHPRLREFPPDQRREAWRRAAKRVGPPVILFVGIGMGNGVGAVVLRETGNPWIAIPIFAAIAYLFGVLLGATVGRRRIREYLDGCSHERLAMLAREPAHVASKWYRR